MVGFEPTTFCVWSRCDNHYTTRPTYYKTIFILAACIGIIQRTSEYNSKSILQWPILTENNASPTKEQKYYYVIGQGNTKVQNMTVNQCCSDLYYPRLRHHELKCKTITTGQVKKLQKIFQSNFLIAPYLDVRIKLTNSITSTTTVSSNIK